LLVHEAARIAKRFLPTPIFRAVRGVSTGILTPLAFSYQSGHFLSSLKSKAVDKKGIALPWYTYPAIDFLQYKELADKSTLEFGSGQSTLWWAARVNKVTAFEDDQSWYQSLLQLIPDNVELFLSDTLGSEVERKLAGRTFDVIVVDGLDRLACAEKSIGFLNEGGAVLLDNSEGYWGRDGEYPIIDLFRENGFSRIDFYGYAPGVILPSCTSLFFKDKCFLLSGAESPVRTVR
jgi:hypothetical protein